MTHPRNPESGYALLLVYAMAAVVAIMLYVQLPKVIFEAQRDKEQLLIDRGEQYSRAVQLYVRKYNRFPIDIDALEKTQGLRFLRRKYVDPMTGKDDWRLIHVGPGGQFTDSLTHAKKDSDKNPQQTFVTELTMTQPTSGAQGGVNIGTRNRASDQPGAPGQGGSAGPANNEPGAPPPNNGPVMVLTDGRIVPANSTGQAPPAPVAGQPGQPGISGFNGIQTPNGVAFQPGGPGGPPNAASNLINQILTTPRPPPGGGVDFNGNALQANTGTSAGNSLGGQVVGGGFAGVASKLEEDGIKVYGDRTAYNEWEFVYDITKDPMRAAGNRAGLNGQQGQNGQNGQLAGQQAGQGGAGGPGGPAGPGGPNFPGFPGQPGPQQPGASGRR